MWKDGTCECLDVPSPEPVGGRASGLDPAGDVWLALCRGIENQGAPRGLIDSAAVSQGSGGGAAAVRGRIVVDTRQGSRQAGVAVMRKWAARRVFD